MTERGYNMTIRKKREDRIIQDENNQNVNQSNQESQTTKGLGTKSINKLLLQFSVPAVIAMIVNAIYNIVDRIFVGKYVGETALAGLTISFPIMMCIFAFAGLVGVGGSALMSIRFGEKDIRGVSHVLGNMMSLGTIITGITLITIFFNLNDLLVIFGATPEIIASASSYMKIILAGFIFQMLAFSLSGAVRTEGQPILSMISMMISAVTNIILDYIFIAIFNWGVEGAAYATIAGQLLGLLILLSFYFRGKSSLRFKLKDFLPDGKVVIAILSIGFASLITTLGTSIAMTFLNRSLSKYGGVAAITSMGAINSLYTLFIMPIMGLQQGMQPIIGYNHGANLRKRVYETLKKGLIVAITFSTIVFLALEIFPELFISMFLDPSSATIDGAVKGLRILIIMLPLLSINLLGVGFFQSIARGTASIALGLLRQLILLVPIVMILPKFTGLTGVWAATPVADGIAIIVTAIVLIINYKNEKSNDNDTGEKVVMEV
ncbi:MAG: putative efflux protein family [Herbinix sp.]|jgi:putative MATE family efflux protein|nr:putative efflux protein family [Herbinix sp.]